METKDPPNEDHIRNECMRDRVTEPLIIVITICRSYLLKISRIFSFKCPHTPPLSPILTLSPLIQPHPFLLSHPFFTSNTTTTRPPPPTDHHHLSHTRSPPPPVDHHHRSHNCAPPPPELHLHTTTTGVTLAYHHHREQPPLLEHHLTVADHHCHSTTEAPQCPAKNRQRRKHHQNEMWLVIKQFRHQRTVIPTPSK